MFTDRIYTFCADSFVRWCSYGDKSDASENDPMGWHADADAANNLIL